MSTLASWKTNVTEILVRKLPLQTIDSVNILVNSYLAENGGWVPSGTDPTGEGEPATGESEAEAAQTITDENLAKIYTIDSEVTLRLRFNLIEHLSAGLTDAVVLSEITDDISTYLDGKFPQIALDLIDISNVAGSILRNGLTTAVERRDIQSEITNSESLRHIKSIGLNKARLLFGNIITNNWNVYSCYTEPNQDIAVIIRKYTTTSYDNLDSSETREVVISLTKDTYNIATGIVKTIE